MPNNPTINQSKAKRVSIIEFKEDNLNKPSNISVNSIKEN